MPLRVIIPRWFFGSGGHDERERKEEPRHEKDGKHIKKLKKKNH